MEKYGVIKDGITPELNVDAVKTAKDCAKASIVDNDTDKTAALDADFRKRAADAAASKLTND